MFIREYRSLIYSSVVDMVKLVFYESNFSNSHSPILPLGG